MSDKKEFEQWLAGLQFLKGLPHELYWQCWTAAQDKLRARNAELERQIAEAKEEELRIHHEKHEWMDRALEAEQRIAESQRQEPKFWIDPTEANLSEHDAVYVYAVGEPGFDGCTMALYPKPTVTPDVEEAVKAEREVCAPYMRHRNDEHVFCESLKSEDSPCTCGLDAIRARSTK